MGMFLHMILRRLATDGAAEAENAVNAVFSCLVVVDGLLYLRD